LRPDDLDTSSLEAHSQELVLWPTTRADQIVERLQSAEVAVINKVRLDRAVLSQLPELKLVCLAATGTDNIDLAAAGELGIAVTNIRNYCTPSVVQHVFALILTLNQHLTTHRETLAQGAWQQAPQFCLLEPPFAELQGKTLGLIGLGTLGGAVAGVARAFGMRVIAARLPWRSTQPLPETGQSAPRLPLHQLLQQSDIVSLHCPLNDDTRDLIDKAALDQMKSNALLINTARGGLVDSTALMEALLQQEIGGAGIDVLPEEPPVTGNPLLEHSLPNLVVTPHVAWSARESRQRALDEILANILAFAAGEQRNRVA